MLTKLRSRLTYANVMATIAVFLALGGSAYAALRITGANVVNGSLTGLDIKDNSMSGKDVKGIQSADIVDGSLLAQDFKAGQLPEGPQGPQGLQGVAGTNGKDGNPGSPGPPSANMLTGRINNIVTSGTSFIAPSGDSAADTTSTALKMLSPNAPIVARDLAIKLETAPGGSFSRVFTLTDDGLSTPIECTIAGAATTCNSGAASMTIDPGSELVLREIGDAGSASTSLEFGWRATTP